MYTDQAFDDPQLKSCICLKDSIGTKHCSDSFLVSFDDGYHAWSDPKAIDLGTQVNETSIDSDGIELKKFTFESVTTKFSATKQVRNPAFYASGCDTLNPSGPLQLANVTNNAQIVGENLEVSFVHTAFLNEDGSAAIFAGCLCFERDAYPTEELN